MGNSNNKIEQDNSEVDSIVQSVIQQFISRAKFGKKKYGTTLDRKDLSMKDWIQHAQEELMDAILYLEKLKKTISEGDVNIDFNSNIISANGNVTLPSNM